MRWSNPIDTTPVAEAQSPAITITIGSSIMSAGLGRVAPMAMAATMEPTYDSKRSAPMPATSPTLSPTLSAITAGLRGSSSGMPASSLPTRSAPTSADLVKMPPPTRAKSAIEEAPMAKPLMTRGSGQRRKKSPRPRMPRAATVSPMTEPPKKATACALSRPMLRAASAVRTFALVAAFMPTKPASMEQSAPATKASAVYRLMARERNTATTTMKAARIEYSRRRKAMAPVCMAAAISVMALEPRGCAATNRERMKASTRPPTARLGASTWTGTSEVRLEAARPVSFDLLECLVRRLGAGDLDDGEFLGLETRQHVIDDFLAWALGSHRPADADLDPSELISAQRSDNGAHAVVAARAAPEAQADLAEG